jgi:protoporphyrinogen oxidase
MVPPGCQSASCEITVQPGSELDAWDDEKLVTRVVADMQRDGLLDPKSVCFTQVHRERFAYVVYDEGHARRMALVRSFAATRGIHLAGRFAEFQYVNTDACVRRALDLARHLRGGSIAKEADLPEMP